MSTDTAVVVVPPAAVVVVVAPSAAVVVVVSPAAVVVVVTSCWGPTVVDKRMVSVTGCVNGGDVSMLEDVSCGPALNHE